MPGVITGGPIIYDSDKLDMFRGAIITAVQRNEVEHMFERDELFEKLWKDAQQRAESSGYKISEEDFRAEFDNFLDKQHRFQKPNKNLEYWLADKYARRKELTSRYGLPVSIVSTIGALATAGFFAIPYVQERNLENKLIGQISSIEELQSDSSLLRQVAEREELADFNNDMIRHLNQANDILAGLGFTNLGNLSENSVRKLITTENLVEYKEKVDSFSSNLNEARKEIRQASGLMQQGRYLEREFSALNSLYGTIPPEIHPMFERRASAAYDLGIKAYETQNIEGLDSSISELQGILNEHGEFVGYQTLIPNLCERLELISQDPAADSEISTQCNRAEDFLTSANVSRLGDIALSLKNLEGILNQEYTLTLVTREGEKTGIDRYYTDENGTRSAGYYLIVEPRDSTGRTIPIPITSIEDGSTANARIWGERVPLETYNAVGADKTDNGILNVYGVYGEKKIGYLEPVITLQSLEGTKRLGQIRRW